MADRKYPNEVKAPKKLGKPKTIEEHRKRAEETRVSPEVTIKIGSQYVRETSTIPDPKRRKARLEARKKGR